MRNEEWLIKKDEDNKRLYATRNTNHLSSYVMTIDDVDFSNKQAVYYFDNPFELDFHTNYIYIARMCGEVDS
jgi:hypothetical protein